MPAPDPFEQEASEYDDRFTRSRIGTLMRRAIWERLDANFESGQHVLELNCGTGEDAVYLARRGVRVLATDKSGEMVRLARQKVARVGLGDRVVVRQLAFEQLGELEEGHFDGGLSNFGGLNCAGDLEAVARDLASRLSQGAALLLCVMGPVVPWEWFWFLAHGKPGKAFRRLRPGGAQWRGMRVSYPRIRTIRRAFSPEFRLIRTMALGTLVPPPYTEDWIAKHPRLLSALNRWERRLESVPPLPFLADHYLVEMERVQVPAGPDQ